MRKLKVVSFPLTFVLVSLLLSTSSLAQIIWNYSAPLDWRSNFTIDKGERKLTSGMLVLDLEFCEAHEKFICFQSKLMNFSVPTNIITSENSSWIYRGNTYDGSPLNVPFRILGQEVSVYQIDSLTQDPKMRFFYSKDRGLIGFTALNDGDAPHFFSESACGFGAPSSCRDTEGRPWSSKSRK